MISLTWFRWANVCLVVALLVGWGLGGYSGHVAHGDASAASEIRLPEPPFRDLDFSQRQEVNGKTIVKMASGDRAELTLDLGFQHMLEQLLIQAKVPEGAVVAIHPKDGRVLAYVSHSEDKEGGEPNLASRAVAPAASIFKVVTASALIDTGTKADTSVCYGGGMRALSEQDLNDNPKRDQWCVTLADALGGSVNAVFGKLADRKLDRDRLFRYVDAFAFNQRLPFDLSVQPSFAEVPEARLERARMAAGFWHTHLSAVHGALIAATIANNGNMPFAGVVENIRNSEDMIVYSRKTGIYRSVLPAATANTVGEMMERTVTTGTSKKSFCDPRGQPFFPTTRIAGKTGTLSDADPYRGYTWWIGFAPIEKPEIALAVLMINGEQWRLKASQVAKEALQYYFNNCGK